MSNTFDPNAYGPEVARILNGLPLSPLGPAEPREELRPAFAAIKLPAICQTGLWLRCDFLHESHEISQELHTSEGSFWHAIMHRREPDAFNSKYWWRLVGLHPVLNQLVAEAPAIGYKYTTPYDFVDYCEKVRGTGSDEEKLALRVQQLEWELLFDWCWNSAS
jgi:hypothetical protein